MYLPLVEKEAARLNVSLECCDMPDYIDSVLLSKAGGAVSVVSSRLSRNEKALAHAVNLGKYCAMLKAASDQNAYAQKWASSLLNLDISQFQN